VCQGGEVGEGHLKTFHRARVPSLFRSWPPCLRQNVYRWRPAPRSCSLKEFQMPGH
jgi:hypothetical protein